MSEEHSADEMDETGRTAAVNRRNFVKALGVTGALGFSGMSSAQAQSADEDKIKREITNITGSAQREYISMALSDADVSTITKNLEQDGWETDRSEATVDRIDKADEDSDLNFSRYHVVSIPLRKVTSLNNESESARIIWTDKSLEKVGFETPTVLKIENMPSDSSDIVTQDIGDNPPVVTEYTVENDELTKETSTIESELMSPGQVRTQGCFCRFKVLKCENLGIWCYVSLAAAYAGTYWACGACGFGAWFACGKCAVAVVGSGAGTVSCIENRDCWQKTVCRSRDQINQKPCRLCNNIHHPNC